MPEINSLDQQTMNDEIRFEIVNIKSELPGKDRDGVAVIRHGRQVAALPEADRLKRALRLPLEEIEHIAYNLPELLQRDPTPDEEEFWRAVLDFRQSQNCTENINKSEFGSGS
jgi:hypothetical protein